MASNVARGLRVFVWAGLSVLVVIALAVAASHVPQLARALEVGWLPATLVVVVLALAAAVVAAAFPWPSPVPGEPTDTEPLIPPPSLPACRRVSPVIAFHALEPRCGSTTLAFNLAVQVAAVGTVAGDRRPRPICLLTAGQLTTSLGLDPAPLSNYFLSHRASVDESVVDLAVRHPSGCELLCVGPDTLNGQRLRLLIPVLRRAYDLVVLEVPSGDRWLIDVAVETSDVSLLIARPTLKSASAAAAWADRAWERGLEGKLALIVDQAAATQPMPTSLMSGLLHLAVVPDDPVVATNDLKGFPWVLRFESRARDALARFAQQLLPDLMNQEADRAA